MHNTTRRDFIIKSAQGGLGAGLLASAGGIIQGCRHRHFDLLIVNASIYDGSGSAARRGDIGRASCRERVYHPV